MALIIRDEKKSKAYNAKDTTALLKAILAATTKVKAHKTKSVAGGPGQRTKKTSTLAKEQRAALERRRARKKQAPKKGKYQRAHQRRREPRKTDRELELEWELARSGRAPQSREEREESWGKGASRMTEDVAPKKGETSWWDGALETAGSIAKVLGPVILGMGDYTEADGTLATGEEPESNSLLAACTNGMQGGNIPYMHSRGNVTRISKREYIGDVYSTTAAFSAVEFPINPGMQETFPWLAPIASQYTGYRMRGMTAEFVSEGSEYANVAGLGYVGLATKYNALQAPFPDKRTFLNSQFADVAKPSKSFIQWIECKPSETLQDGLFVRSYDVPANADVRLYDLGTLALAVGGNTAAGSIIGELWISYDIDLYFPKLDNTFGGTLQYAVYNYTGVTNAIPMGTTQARGGRTSMTMTFTANTFAFPNGARGIFEVSTSWTSAAGVAAPVTPAYVGTNCTVVGSESSGTTAGATYAYARNYVTVAADGALVTLVGGSFANGATQGYIIVNQVPSSPPSVPTPGTEIFDFQGRNSEALYIAQLKKFQAEENAPEKKFETLFKTNVFKVKLATGRDGWYQIVTIADGKVVFEGYAPCLQELGEEAKPKTVDLVVSGLLAERMRAERRGNEHV